ncbi:MAG: fibronectin type III domain-containing protein [Nitrospirales bacterium]
MVRHMIPWNFANSHVTGLAFLFIGLFASPAFSASSIQLSWDANPEPDLMGYNVYMGTSKGSYSTTKNTGLNPSYVFQNLSQGITYYFTVTAYDQTNNESLPSEEVSVKIPDIITPTTPGNLTLNSASNTQVAFSWTASTDNVGVAGYDVARNNVVIGQPTTNAFVDKSTSPGMTYLYTVKARDASGNVSASSSPLSVSVPIVSLQDPLQDMISPSVPKNLTLNSTSGTQVAFSWTASTDNVGVTGYDVARNNVVIGQPTTNAFVDKTTSPGMTYYYTVQARDANGNVSPWSPPLQFTTPQVMAKLEVFVSGSGSVVSIPNGINCPRRSCSTSYPNQTVMTLTPKPGNGWIFSGWSGSCTGTATCSLTLTENRTVNANFTKGSRATSGNDSRNVKRQRRTR